MSERAQANPTMAAAFAVIVQSTIATLASSLPSLSSDASTSSDANAALAAQAALSSTLNKIDQAATLLALVASSHVSSAPHKIPAAAYEEAMVFAVAVMLDAMCAHRVAGMGKSAVRIATRQRWVAP